MERADYSVRLEINGENGSGILYVPEAGAHAYIITAAHFFKGEEMEYKINVFWEGQAFNCEDKNRPEDCVFIGQITEIKSSEESFRIILLRNFDRMLDDSPDDGAVIEIDYQPWMYRGNFQFGTAKQKDAVSGYGYPINAELKRTELKGEIENAVKQEVIVGEDGDYDIVFDPNRYKGETDTDKSYLDAFSGTGLFVEENETYYYIGIFSRSKENIPRLYLTDARKVYRLIAEMNVTMDLPIIETNIIYGDEKDESLSLEFVLEEFLTDRSNFIRCLHGYAGTGKTYAADHLEEICARNPEYNYTIERNWLKLVECLNTSNLSKLANTIYVFDCIENRWGKVERKKISFVKGTSIDKDKGKRRLNGAEKAGFFDKIMEREEDLRKNNIHILIIFRTNFLRDMREYLKMAGRKLRWEQIESFFVNCIGYDQNQVRQILGEGCPTYIVDDEMTRRPRWTKYILENGLSNIKDKNAYEYEFQVIKDTLSWYIKEEFDEDERGYSLKDDDERLSQLKTDYIRYVLNDGRKIPKWSENLHPLLWAYPFLEVGEEKNKYKMDDEVLYAYFVAEELAKLVINGDEEAFTHNISAAYYIGSKNNPLGNRIVAFFFIFLKGKEEARSIARLKIWLLDQEYDECRAWLDRAPEMDYFFMYNKERNKKQYKNLKHEKINEEYMFDKNEVVDMQTNEWMNMDELGIDYGRIRRKEND